jgi:hypothetical protein
MKNKSVKNMDVSPAWWHTSAVIPALGRLRKEN